MKRRIISTLAAVSLLNVMPCTYAVENDNQAELFDVSGTEDYSGEEASYEELPVEFSEPDPTKSDRFIIKYKRNAVSEIREQTAQYSVKSISNISDNDETFTTDNSDDTENVSNIQSIQLNEEVDIEEFINDIMLNESEDIEYIQPDYKIELSAFGGDVDNKSIISADNEKELSNNLPKENLMDIGTKEESENERETVVALIDTGIDINHMILNGHIYTNILDNNADEDGNGYIGDINGWDFYNNTPYVSNPDLGLDQAHGTHVAGIIANEAPNTKILPLKVFEGGTAYTSDIIEAIRYAENMGADVVNCSWGCTDENAALKEAIANSRMTFVCAVGNNRLDLNETPIYPACYNLNNIVSVTSVNNDGGLSYFSNYGNVDIAAPGRDVEGIFPENTTGVLSGTSISAAYVTGAIAAGFTTGEETVNRLYSSADKLANLQETVKDGKRVNLENLLNNITISEVIDINPEEDFNTEGYTRTPSENWELFTALDNVSIKTGVEYIAVLKADGSVWTWGKNNYGQLGTGDKINTTVPKQVSSINNVVEISAGADHMLARKADGTVYGWGRNYNGCLGIGTSSDSVVPMKMSNVSNATNISAGHCVSYVVKDNGELYSCGSNDYGQLGDGTNVIKTILTKVKISDKIKYVDGIVAGAAAVSENGAVYTWGLNAYNRLGTGTSESYISVPQKIIDNDVKQVSVGFFSMIGVTNDGQVYLWGNDGEKTPKLVDGIKNADKAVAGRQSLFVKCQNKIQSKGINNYGILGVGDINQKTSWTSVLGEFIDFDVREYWGAAIGDNGCIYTWGIRNADTGEYVTAPEKLSDKINDFASDEIDSAAAVSLGKTHGNLISASDVDYYKFTPKYTAIYSVYSLSELDLVCKIYTKNSDGTYTLRFSNDDGNGIMGGGQRDFFISKPMTANTDYYIYVYSFGNKYEGEYSLFIQKDGDNNVRTMSVVKGMDYNVFINVNNVNSFTNRTIKVTYNPEQMKLIDGCIFTPENNTDVGVISGTNIQVVSVSPGEIEFKVTYAIPLGKKISGTVNILKFEALKSGYTVAAYKLNDLS